MIKRLISTIICLLLVLSGLLGSGCSQQKEVQLLAIVEALTFDKVTDKGEDKYRASALIYKPSEMSGGKEGGNKSSTPYWLTSAMGISLADAQRKLTTNSSRSILYSHNQLIIVGERLMREDGIDKLIDLTLRSREIRLHNFILVSKGEASDVLTVSPQLEPNPSQEIVKQIEVLKNESNSYVPDLKEFFQNSLNPGRDLLLGKIEIKLVPEKLLVGKEKGTETLNLTGATSIRGSKLAGWLNEEEVRGFLFVVNRIKGGEILVKLPSEQQESFTCQIIKAKTEITPQLEEDELSFNLEVTVDLRLVDIEGKEPITKQSETEKLNELVAKNIKQIIEGSVQKSQNIKSDFFGFGDIVHRKYPDKWKEMESEWEDLYSDLPISVNVEAKIRVPGMITSPVEVK